MTPSPARLALQSCTLALAVALTLSPAAGQTTASPPRGGDEGERTGSKTPPKGPPWTTDFFAAHRRALAESKPIFVYSTKTH